MNSIKEIKNAHLCTFELASESALFWLVFINFEWYDIYERRNKYFKRNKKEAVMTVQRLTQKYTNEVQQHSQKHFGYLTERMYAYRDKVLDKKPYIDAERAILATES